jgi:WD40 repeat protein/serine/threonine protein kinase
MGLRLMPEATEAPTVELGSGPSSERIGHYKLLQMIGEGGCGTVYMAEQEEPVRRRVALKVIKLGMDTRQVVARFEAERQALALMDHPNIAKVLDGGATETGRPYFVMELVKGVKITDYCDQNHLSPAERLELFVQTCQAIQHAHQKGIIHRDIKPSNILVTLHDGAPVPKVIDFGVAKATEQALTDKTLFTSFNQFIGTPTYMSPEQAERSGLDIDTRSDIYSLGVLLYELLIGKTPFDAKELLKAGWDEMRRTIREKEPARPSTRLSTMMAGELTRTAEWRHCEAPKLIALLRGDLDWIVMKALEKDRTRRYETANGLALDVRRYLSDEPVMARPPSKVYRFHKFVRRNKLVFTAGAITAAALILGLGLSTWLFFREAKARRIAVEARTAQESLKIKEAKARQEAELKAEMERRSRYENDMSLAQSYLHEGNPAQAFELLRKHLPDSGQEDLRGFEWRHLWHECRGDYGQALPVHKQVVGAMTFAPVGSLLATWCWDDTLRVWDLESQSNLLTVLKTTALGGFTSDGQRLVFGRKDGSIAEWRLATGELTNLLTNVGELVAVAAGAKTVVTIDSEKRLRAWDLETCRVKFLAPGSFYPSLDFNWSAGVALSPQGKLLAVVEQSKLPGQVARGISLWDIDSQTNLCELEEARQIRCLQFSPDGKLLAVGDGGGVNEEEGTGGSIWLWELATRKARHVPVGARPVLSLAFSPNGEMLACGSSDQTIALWNVADLSQRQRRFSGQVGQVWSLAFSADGQRLASGSRDTTVKIWNLKGEQTQQVVSDLDSENWGNFCFSLNGRLMAGGCKNKTVRAWKVDTLEQVRELPGASYAVGFVRDGRLLVSSKDELPKWWDIATGDSTPLPVYPQKLAGYAPCVDLSADRRIAALGFNTGAIQLVDIESGTVTATVKDAHPGGVDCVAFSSQGDKLVSGGRDKSVALWEIRADGNGEVLKKTGRSPDHKGIVCAVAVAPGGNMLASGCSAGTLKFWDLADRLQKPPQTIAYHESVIRTLCFSPDRKTLASGSEDNTVKLWNTRSCRQVASFNVEAHVRLVLFSPDGNNLAVVTDQGRLHLFRATPRSQADQELAALSIRHD